MVIQEILTGRKRSEMEIKFIGWCRNEEQNNDKVWGIALYGRGEDDFTKTYATFWGRRGKKLQKKLVEMDSYAAVKLIASKRKKGYVEFPADEADEIYENFSKDIFMVALSVK